MKRKLFLLLSLCFSFSLFAFNFRSGVDDEDDGFFIVSGDDAVFGIVALISCFVIAGACSFITEKNKHWEEENGFLKYVYWFLLTIGGLAGIGMFVFAISMWWFVLILFVLLVIVVGILQLFHKL